MTDKYIKNSGAKKTVIQITVLVTQKQACRFAEVLGQATGYKTFLMLMTMLAVNMTVFDLFF